MVDIKEIEHLANLARIKLSENDKKSLIKEFGSILSYIDKLKKLDVSIDVEGRLGVIRNVMRDDVARPIDDSSKEDILNKAPDREGDFIAVKKILNAD